MGLGLNKLLDFSKCIHPKVCILQCFGMNKLLGQILAVGRAIRTKSLSLFVLFVADIGDGTELQAESLCIKSIVFEHC